MAILDACARLLISNGASNLTMHGIAREAGTSIGSLYHFFSDKHGVLDALGQRHVDALSRITEHLLAIDPAVWLTLNTRGVIERMILPILEYMEAHPDILQMISPAFAMGQFKSPDLRAQIKQTYDRVLALRIPRAAAEDRDAYVMAMLGLPVGLFQVALENSQLKSVLLLKELPRAMAAYLQAIEAQHAAPS